jgi:hypothetical protein
VPKERVGTCARPSFLGEILLLLESGELRYVEECYFWLTNRPTAKQLRMRNDFTFWRKSPLNPGTIATISPRIPNWLLIWRTDITFALQRAPRSALDHVQDRRSWAKYHCRSAPGELRICGRTSLWCTNRSPQSEATKGCVNNSLFAEVRSGGKYPGPRTQNSTGLPSTDSLCRRE